MSCAHVIGIDRRKGRIEKRTPMSLVRKLPKVVLADDQEQVLAEVSAIVQSECDIVGLAENGEQVLRLVEEKSPDLLILDISMASLNGFDVALRLRDSAPSLKIVFLTVLEDPDFVNAAISLGALAYVLKAHLVTELMPAIHSVLDSHLYVSPTLVPSLSRC